MIKAAAHTHSPARPWNPALRDSGRAQVRKRRRPGGCVSAPPKRDLAVPEWAGGCQSGCGGGASVHPPPGPAIISVPALRLRVDGGARLCRGEGEGACGRVQLLQLPGGGWQRRLGEEREGRAAGWRAPEVARVPIALTP